MKYLAIVFLVMIATGCASLDVACRGAVDDGNWSLVKDTEDKKKWLEISTSEEDGRVYVDDDSGSLLFAIVVMTTPQRSSRLGILMVKKLLVLQLLLASRTKPASQGIGHIFASLLSKRRKHAPAWGVTSVDTVILHQ